MADMALTICALLGSALSLYALYVEVQASADPMFKAGCDIEWLGASCSKVFTSKYGKVLSLAGVVPAGHMLDLPNAALGLMFYAAVLLRSVLPVTAQLRRQLVFAGSIVACGMSLFLGYTLVFILRDLCVVCTSTYIINAIILIASWRDLGVTTSKSARVDSKHE